MEGNKDKALLLAWAVAAGVAAGTAAAVTATTFPYAVNAAFAAIGAKRRREQREHRHRHKSEKIKRVLSKPKEGRAYRDAVRRSIIKWENIDISFDDFPYFLDECTKNALLDSVFLYLKRPEYVKFTADLSSVSPRVLLTGPLGSEMYQESLVQALAQYLQVKLLVFDSADIRLEVRKSSSHYQDRLMDASSIAQYDQRDGFPQVIEEDNLKFKEEGIVNSEASSLSNRIQEATSALDNFLSISGSKKTVADVSNLGPFTRLNAKSRTEGAKDLATVTAAPTTAMAVDSSRRQLKKGDRVKYVGPSMTGGSPGLAVVAHGTSNGGPTSGSRGRVLIVLEDNLNKVGVRFDKPVYGGNNLLDLCEDGHGYFCNVTELRLEHTSGEDVDKLIFDSLLEVVVSEASKEPFIVFIKNLEKSIAGNFERYMKLERLEKTDATVVIIGSHTFDQQKEKGGSHALTTSKLGNNFTALLDLSLLDHFSSRMEDSRGEASKTSRLLAKLFPSKVAIQSPKDEGLLMQWNRQLEQDMEKLKAQANTLQLRMVMGSSNVDCDELESVDVRTHILTQDMTEKVVGWAINHHLQKDTESFLRNGKLVIGVDSIQHSLAELQSMQRGPSSRKKTLKDVVVENEFEKMLLPEVIPPDELGVTFDHIGALENVKETLRELVMLPLQRPELFVKGQLTKPCRGLLLFGPPGTGKTMLAKAVATEAKANFINISMSTVSSKWFGEAEKYVKAVFTLASKISPSVIFIDEVDSMLGRRGKDTEHSAMRKLKNEFMASWDGLRTRERERVLVLAATNRPFDLDEAVIRRFPRRLMIDLPDVDNRAKILKVILVDEDLSPEFSIEELAAATDRYSGSDLKNLCTTAAYMRIRELLDQEKKAEEKARSAGAETPTQTGVAPYIRPMTMADMRQAMEKVRSSVASDAGSMLELQQWNEQYGEGGTRKKTTLSYFM